VAGEEDKYSVMKCAFVVLNSSVMRFLYNKFYVFSGNFKFLTKSTKLHFIVTTFFSIL
jgi:hypothetical protein